ncbi:MAG: hypothetical protein IPK58_24380 [Acidobacteria bacterium]|nr:hypothetical protein [Acidobacteriota bacterium]
MYFTLATFLTVGYGRYFAAKQVRAVCFDPHHDPRGTFDRRSLRVSSVIEIRKAEFLASFRTRWLLRVADSREFGCARRYI